MRRKKEEPMSKLHPTLWRTCRILSGKTRLELLRQVVEQHSQTVSELADHLKISMPRASQELRRLQSRGLIQARRSGMTVQYHPTPDPLVSTAAPLVHAMKDTFRLFPAPEDEVAIRIAIGFSHIRRLVLLRLLQIGPMDIQTLENLSGMSRDALNRHLRILQTANLVRREGKFIQIDNSNSHPLARTLFNILQESPLPATD